MLCNLTIRIIICRWGWCGLTVCVTVKFFAIRACTAHIKSSKLWLIIFFLPWSGPVGVSPFDGLSYLNYNTITDISLLYKLFERLCVKSLSQFSGKCFSVVSWHIRKWQWVRTIKKMLFVITIWVLCKKEGPLNLLTWLKGGTKKTWVLLVGVWKKFGIKNNFSSTPPSNLNYDCSLKSPWHL